MSEPSGRPFLGNCLLFARALRWAGIPVGLDQTLAFARALAWIDIGSREQVYHTARALLVSRHEHLRLFDTIFSRFWRAPRAPGRPRRQTMPRAPRHRPPHQPFTIVTYLAHKARQSDPAIDIADRAGTASDTEVLRRKDFSQMSPEELARIKRLIEAMHWRISQRVTRRRERDRRGDLLHLGAVLRDAARHGGVPARLAWQRRKIRQRPLVVVADISGSMEKYARLLLQFLYSVTHALQRVECFVFGTRLTRVTTQLTVRNIDQALDQAAREVVDWAGGTRIGASLRDFNLRWGRRVLGRGAVVLLISDGWEHGDPALLAAEVRRLQRRCHRLIWLNPLLSSASYQPRVAGMRAALAYVDDFLPIHNFHSLEALASRLDTVRERRSR